MNKEFWIKKLKLTRFTELNISLADNEKLFFIADVHLNEAKDEKDAFFLKFMKSIDENVKHIFILGDFFNFYLGKPQHLFPCYKDIFDTFKNLNEKGVQIFFLAGNRDTLVNSELEEFGIKKLPTWVKLNISQNNSLTQMLATHGDVLAFTDRMFRLYRLIITATEIRVLSKFFPINFRQQLAEFLQKTISSGNKKDFPLTKIITDINFLQKSFHEAFYTPFRIFPIDFLVIGHWHIQAEIQLPQTKILSTKLGIAKTDKQTEKTCHIIGDWRSNQGAYVEFSNGKITHKLFNS